MAAAAAMVVVVVVGVLVPFPFYYVLWNYPHKWVGLCGKGVDPSHRMAQISHALKALQILSLLSLARISAPPPSYSLLLFLLGQYLNFKFSAFLLLFSSLSNFQLIVRLPTHVAILKKQAIRFDSGSRIRCLSSL